MKILFSKQTFTSLKAEFKNSAKENSFNANKFLKRTQEALEDLKQNPAMGRTGKLFGSKELVLGDLPYFISYRVRGEQIQIIRILHAPRNLAGMSLPQEKR